MYDNFQNQRLLGHLAADHTIVMSETLKVTGNHAIYDRSESFQVKFALIY